MQSAMYSTNNSSQCVLEPWNTPSVQKPKNGVLVGTFVSYTCASVEFKAGVFRLNNETIYSSTANNSSRSSPSCRRTVQTRLKQTLIGLVRAKYQAQSFAVIKVIYVWFKQQSWVTVAPLEDKGWTISNEFSSICPISGYFIRQTVPNKVYWYGRLVSRSPPASHFGIFRDCILQNLM